MYQDTSFHKSLMFVSGHHDIKTLLGYIQHTPSRIRKVYDTVFEKEHISPIKPVTPMVEDRDYYKTMAFKKYLSGEINRKTLDTMLKSFEGHTTSTKASRNIAYG